MSSPGKDADSAARGAAQRGDEPEFASTHVFREEHHEAAQRRNLSTARVKGLARRTFNKQVLSEIGGFAGHFSLDAERFPDPVLVASADGVGSKLQLAAQLGLHASIAADLVNHCVNDVAVQGATPLFFLDSIAAGRLEPNVVEQIISGLVDACRANGCALLGGETAEHPALIRSDAYDLTGFLTGVVSRPRLVTGSDVAEGDLLLALPSNGLHTNGYALAQRLLFDTARYHAEQYVNALGEKVGAALMRPHRSYLAPIRKLLQAEVARGFAHITGGGLTENLPRMLPRGMAALVDLSSWEPPPLFAHLQQLGALEREEMLGTFNMGIGLVAAVPPPLLAKARTVLSRMNERCLLIGRVVKSPQRKVLYS